MKNKYIILIYLMIITLNVFSQSSNENHEKYWYYRYRMKHYFTSVGDDIYQSLVSARRNTQKTGDIYYGDQTLDLGWYMAILATEYCLLSPSGDNDETLTDLYYCLKAFERLDRCEGKYPYENYTEKFDGYFLRKDAEMFSEIVPEDPIIEKMNYKLNQNDVFGAKPLGHPTYANDFTHGDSDINRFEMSQDHVIHLMLGFATIVRAFPNSGITFNNYITGEKVYNYNFLAKASEITDKLMVYIKNANSPGVRWMIYRPDGEKVFRGSDTRPYSFGFVDAALNISGTNHIDYISFNTGIIWKGLRHFNPWGSNNAMELILGTIGNSWPDQTVSIFEKSKVWNWDFFYIPWYHFLHGESTYLERAETILEELNNAPLCGPYNYNDPSGYLNIDCCGSVPAKPGDGWSSHNRYRRTKEESNGEHDEEGNFPGIDYMITYNLYHLFHGSVTFHNMLNPKLQSVYPYQQNGTWYGTENNPANLRAFETFECNNEIETNANGDGSLNLIASNSIKLTPGFHVYQGAHFSAKIEEYDCWAAGGNGGNKSSYFHDNGYVYNYNPDPMEVIDDETENKSQLQVKEKVIENKLLVFPNPAQNQIQFQFENAYISSYPLIIRDVYGNIAISKANYQSGETIDISALINGIYIAEVVIDGRVYQEKFVVL